jgi:hypothetical protein
MHIGKSGGAGLVVEVSGDVFGAAIHVNLAGMARAGGDGEDGLDFFTGQLCQVGPGLGRFCWGDFGLDFSKAILAQAS